mmetsp:Transcript_61697/g.70768  ORF Transcript_61697/g.70768 Transcript_61697/m.70768 type:complete len:82 (+) Transcript_61697:96-341(+)
MIGKQRRETFQDRSKFGGKDTCLILPLDTSCLSLFHYVRNSTKINLKLDRLVTHMISVGKFYEIVNHILRVLDLISRDHVA